MKRMFAALVIALSIVGSASVTQASAGSSDTTTTLAPQTTESELVEVPPVGASCTPIVNNASG